MKFNQADLWPCRCAAGRLVIISFHHDVTFQMWDNPDSGILDYRLSCTPGSGGRETECALARLNLRLRVYFNCRKVAEGFLSQVSHCSNLLKWWKKDSSGLSGQVFLILLGSRVSAFKGFEITLTALEWLLQTSWQLERLIIENMQPN